MKALLKPKLLRDNQLYLKCRSCNFLIKILNCQHAVKIVRVAKVFELAFQHSAMGFSPCTGGETFSKKIFHLCASAELLLPSR